jgi:alpha-amylase
VLLDIVYNHPGYESSFTRRPDADRWVRTEARGDCGEDAITSCVAGLPDFKTEHPEVAEYLMDAHLSLAKRVGLDGFRLDTVKHVTHEFWQAHRQRVNAQLGEDFFLLGEVWGGDSRVLDPWFKQDEMDAGFDFSFKGSVQGFVQGRGRTIAFAKYLEKRHRVRDGYVLSHYLSSHDVPGALFELNGNKALFKLCVALQFTTLGMPQIYYGEEVGREGGDWPHNRSHMPWGDRDIKPGAGEARDEDMRAWYKRLIAIRHAHEPLRDGDYRILSAEGDLLVFARADADEEVWVALNRGSEAAAVDLAVPELWRDREIVEAVAAEPVTVGDAGVAVKVPARSVRIYVGR